MGVLKRLRTGRAASQGVALFRRGMIARPVLPSSEGTGWSRSGWSGRKTKKELTMGRNVTLSIGALILILIVVAFVF